MNNSLSRHRIVGRGSVLYKAYEGEKEAVICTSLTELRQLFDLDYDETRICGCSGVHTLRDDLKVITFRN